MKKTHILENDLKTLNGESLIGDGDISVEPVSVDASTLTEEQLSYIRDRQMSYGAWSVTPNYLLNYVMTPDVTKMPIFNTKITGNLVASTEDTFLLKKNRVYKIEFSIGINSANTNFLRFALYNDTTNTILSNNPNVMQSPASGNNYLYESFYSDYIRVDIDTPISIRMESNNSSKTGVTLPSVTHYTKINIMEISTTDVKLVNFKINGKSFDENNNIDLEGLSTLASPKLNQEILTEHRHPTSGKPVYTKSIDFGSLPNATTKSVAHGVVDGEDIWLDGSNASIILQRPHPTNLAASWTTGVDKTSVSVITGSNRTIFTATITILYTKTTDTAESPVRLVGGGFKYIESSTEPDNPSLGDEWHNTTNDILYKRRKKNDILGWYEI